MDDPQAALRRFLAALDSALTAGAAAQPDAAATAAVKRFGKLVRGIRPDRVWSDSTAGAAVGPFGLPVCRFWNGALDRAGSDETAELAASLRSLGPALDWRQNPNYRRRPPNPAFLESYGYAVIAGPSVRDGPAPDPALAEDDRLAVGVLLLGPHTHYGLHHHPATEVYCVVGGAAEWRRGDRAWRREPPGAIIYHASQVPHATRTGGEALLAVYLWQGALGTRARLLRAS